MTHRIKLSFLASLIFVGCIQSPNPSHEIIHTFVQGRVYLDSPQAGATVELIGKDAQGGVTLPLAQTITDNQGDWQVSLGSYEGPVQVTAHGAQIGQKLDALIPWVSPNESLDTVAVTPITHIIAAYGRYLIRTGNRPNRAFFDAADRIKDLFGGVPQQNILLQPWPQGRGEQQPTVITDAVSSMFYLSAMDELAQRISSENNIKPKTTITLESLAGALAEDIEADGNFDGLGNAGRHIKLGNTPLTGHTIRTDLPLALHRFSENHGHNTVIKWPEIRPLAYALNQAMGPMFNQYAPYLCVTGPKLVGCEVTSDFGEKKPVNRPQHGFFRVVCE